MEAIKVKKLTLTKLDIWKSSLLRKHKIKDTDRLSNWRYLTRPMLKQIGLTKYERVRERLKDTILWIVMFGNCVIRV